MNKKEKAGESADRVSLKLYVTGMSEKSMQAIRTVKRIIDEHLKDCCDLEIIDLYKVPQAAQENQIIFSPSLVKLHPLPKRVLIGSFSDTNKLKEALGIPLT